MNNETCIEELREKLAAERQRADKAEAQVRHARADTSAALEHVRTAFLGRGASTPGGGLAGILAGVHDLADRAEQAERELDAARGAVIACAEGAEADVAAMRARAEQAEQAMFGWGNPRAPLAERIANMVDVLRDTQRAMQSSRERAEKAERDRDEAWTAAREHAEARKNADVARSRAETARERAEASYAEANERWRTASQDASAFRDRLERAEADNAALLKLVDLAGHSLGMGQTETAMDILLKASVGDGPGTHPGAALLQAHKQEVETLKADNAALVNDARTGLMFWHGNACSMAGGAYPSDPSECADAICREWMARVRSSHTGAALKVPHE